MESNIRIGYGYDVHVFSDDRPLILGGVKIDFHRGLKGHSDADVLLHAICDALLGALGLGDIGTHFPDKDDDYINIDSRILLKRVYALLAEEGYSIGNVDSTIVAQQPKLAPYISQMREIISGDLNTTVNKISVKATTSEELGFEGREEGISARAVALIFRS